MRTGRPCVGRYACSAKAKGFHPKMKPGKHKVLMEFTSDGKPNTADLVAPDEKPIPNENTAAAYRMVFALPEIAVPVLEEEQGHDLYDRLARVARDEGLQVERGSERLRPQVMGFYAPTERLIVLR